MNRSIITIKDVTKKYGCSVCTVSRALSGRRYLKEETKQRILETVVELGCHPSTLAVNLKAGHRQVLTLILPSPINICYAKLEQYLESCTSEKGYIIYLNNTGYSLEKEEQILENLIGMDIAGVIITPATGQHGHIMNLVKYDIPHVCSSRSFEDGMEHCLRLDNRKAAYKAVSYMIKLGHKDTGDIFQSSDNLTYWERCDGMIQALREYGLDYRPGHMLFDVSPEDMGTTPGRVLQLIQETDRPEAIFVCNNMAVFDIYRARYILGLRILDHLSVFGYDDCVMANYVTPPLSAASIPIRKLVGTVIDFICGYLGSGVWAELPIPKASLIIRNSVCNLNLD